METLFYFGVGFLLLVTFLFLLYFLGLFISKVVYDDYMLLDTEDIFLYGIMGLFGIGILFILFLAFTLIGKLIITNI